MAAEVMEKKEATGVVEYESNGESVKLSPTMVKKYLVSGGGAVTDQEVMMFLSLCRYQHLNPFLREAYLIKYGSKSPATMVTGKEVFTKRADSNPKYDGKEAGVIVLNENGDVSEREGTMVLPNESLVGGWAKVYIKGHRVPEYTSVNFDEYVGRKSDGEINGQWKTKPATMIRKVAVVQALREAFPDTFQGIYAQEEITEVSDVKLDTQEVVMSEISKNANTEDFVEDVPDGNAVEQTEEADGDIPDFAG